MQNQQVRAAALIFAERFPANGIQSQDDIEQGRGQTAEDADLVILAPTTAECLTNGWLRKAVQSVSQRLRADGVAYVLSPAWWRLSIRTLLYDHGLSIEETILHLPDQGSSRYLIPLSPRPAQYAISKLLSLSFSKRLLAAVGVWLLNSDWRFKCLLPSVGLVVRRPGARPILEWLFRLNSEPNGSAIITTGSTRTSR